MVFAFFFFFFFFFFFLFDNCFFLSLLIVDWPLERSALSR
jgi:hypothetical protein